MSSAHRSSRAPRRRRAPDSTPRTSFRSRRQIQQVEVISEFRRAVILTEEHLRRGDWLFAQGGRNLDGHNLEDALKQWTGRLVIAARLQFGPLHAYATVPDVRIALEGSPAVVAINLRSIPRSSFPAGTAGTRPDGRRYRKRFRSLRRRTRRAPDQRVRQRHAQRARDSRFSVAWTSRSCTIRRSPCRTR